MSVPPLEVVAYLSADVIDEVAGWYRELTPAAPREGRAALFTAGPPGAGKSVLVEQIAGDHRVIDPDDIKDLLLQRLERDGLLFARHGHRLVDGLVVRPAELALWVHTASTEVADAVREDSLALGENFMMAGTLAWGGLPDQYAGELRQHDYETLTIVDIEVPLKVAQRQARQRWWDGRCHVGGLGGRFISDEAVAAYYEGAASKTAAGARNLFRAAVEDHLTVDLRTMVRDNGGGVWAARITQDGATPWRIPGRTTTPPLGAGCVRCGRPLTALDSIVAGVGRECSRDA